MCTVDFVHIQYGWEPVHQAFFWCDAVVEMVAFGTGFFFHPVRSGVDGKRLGKDCFHGYGPTEIFWRGGILLDFFGGDW